MIILLSAIFLKNFQTFSFEHHPQSLSGALIVAPTRQKYNDVNRVRVVLVIEWLYNKGLIAQTTIGI